MDIRTTDFEICGDVLVATMTNIGFVSDTWLLHAYDSSNDTRLLDDIPIRPADIWHQKHLDTEPRCILPAKYINIGVVIKNKSVFLALAHICVKESEFTTGLEPFERYLENEIGI